MPNLKLLIVEDDADIADVISRVAGEMGIIASQTNGLAAMAAHDEFKPDIIVLDMIMPGVDGLEVLQLLHDRKSTARIVIISGSKMAYRQIADNIGQQLGMPIDANIAKPFRIEELRDILKQVQQRIVETSKEIA